jgi:hypothetical protein
MAIVPGSFLYYFNEEIFDRQSTAIISYAATMACVDSVRYHIELEEPEALNTEVFIPSMLKAA